MTTTTSTHRACATCGATFRKSPNDSTVNCPEHRGRAKAAPRRKHNCVVCADTRVYTERTASSDMRSRPCPRCAS